MSEIIKQLKTVRIAGQLKQSDLGVKIGLPQSHISKIEQGLTDPRLSTVEVMAHVMDQELILVPRPLLTAVKALLNSEDAEDQPMWQIDEDKEDG